MPVWNIEVVGNPEAPRVNSTAAPLTLQEVRDEASDVYQLAGNSSLANALPLILAAYPSEDANTLRLATNPADGTTTVSTATLDVTLPGSDILVEFSADIGWSLPASVSAPTAGASSVVTSPSSSVASTISTDSHTHAISSLVLVANTSHTHSLSNTSTLGISNSNAFAVPSADHKHKFLNDEGGGFEAFADGGQVFTDVDGNYVVVGGSSDAGDKTTWATVAYSTGSVADAAHKHDLSGVTATASSSHTHTVSSYVVDANTTHTHGIAHTHNIDHTHTVSATSALLDVKAELVVDGTVITAGLSQFHVEGFTGAEGNIQLRSVYVLRKATDTLEVLSSGQHVVGLKFTLTTAEFDTATTTVDANNIALILRDAAFDERVKIFTP